MGNIQCARLQINVNIYYKNNNFPKSEKIKYVRLGNLKNRLFLRVESILISQVPFGLRSPI